MIDSLQPAVSNKFKQEHSEEHGRPYWTNTGAPTVLIACDCTKMVVDLATSLLTLCGQTLAETGESTWHEPGAVENEPGAAVGTPLSTDRDALTRSKSPRETTPRKAAMSDLFASTRRRKPPVDQMGGGIEGPPPTNLELQQQSREEVGGRRPQLSLRFHTPYPILSADPPHRS